jgi:hypothetical protein
MRKPNATGLLITAALVLNLVSLGYAETAPKTGRTPLSAAFKAKNFEDFVAAIHQHETDNRVGRIYGDGGRSYGPLQISNKAWRDALKFDRTIGGKYSDCSNLEYSKKVMRAYIQLHDAEALARGDWESCARLWNSGPAWRTKLRKTNEYWASVRTYLNRGNS